MSITPVVPSTSSWKTTTLGVLGIVSAVVAALQAFLNGNFDQLGLIIPSILAGIGHIFAKDAK